MERVAMDEETGVVRVNHSPYVVEKVPARYLKGCPPGEEPWYCHKKGYDYIPVMGSIGSRKNAEDICRTYNHEGKVHYAGRGKG